MNLRHSNTLILGTAVLTMLAACSRSSETAETLRKAQSARAIGLSGSLQSSEGLECPLAQSGPGVGSLQETSRQIDSMGHQLGTGGENEIRTAVAQLRSRHPNASEGMIVNYLITAYCPTIKARAGMNLNDKQQALRTFATKVRRLASSA